MSQTSCPIFHHANSKQNQPLQAMQFAFQVIPIFYIMPSGLLPNLIVTYHCRSAKDELLRRIKICYEPLDKNIKSLTLGTLQWPFCVKKKRAPQM